MRTQIMFAPPERSAALKRYAVAGAGEDGLAFWSDPDAFRVLWPGYAWAEVAVGDIDAATAAGATCFFG